VESEKAEEQMRKLYKPFLLNNHPIHFMDIASSEMTKYAANAMLATRISFMNDIANLCEIVGADVNKVRTGIGSDGRIGNKFIYAGIGYGGSCFPKDVKALIKTAHEHGYEMRVLNAVEHVNEKQKSVLFDKIKKHYDGKLSGKTFGMWGLSFKPKTDDMREAPSLVLIDKLLRAGAHVVAYDPVAMKEAKHILKDTIRYVTSEYDALKNADALIIVTEWPEFRSPDWDRITAALKEKTIFDGRNIYSAAEMRNQGYSYYGIGVK
jgi:UDPglucose 6-dehydrogenase